ncbi:urea carboxylase [Aestuariibacter sp. A3R04]|uniref:urea carboxylase n=1 Tax=Aestuariibacter sp. A3R04 TaxID=2841571 RepID=UPI001C0A1C23|nr:urea carboxylase [Aestuariibacter sp. A3R04]MBU3021603.1 urea carboxylase [Aestuariibacter sp. A3R04]
MFKKVLIANRGAIATRIIRTLNKLKIESIAIYAMADADSLHVSTASQAHCLGEGSAANTYLNIDKIIELAKQLKVDAIHPGYGFLSENPDFVKRCEQEGIVFVGPTAAQMLEFGLKHSARELAKKANVPLLPGTGLLNSLEHALEQANNIGYPVMLKSTAGGGGIGMQLCHTDDELSQSFESVKRLGKSNFADDGVFLEKYISQARHIEVQAFGDGAGKVVSLGERDCSSQRRNQKVLEECPAPNLTEATRAALHHTAEALLAAVNYRNAGTVEFIVDAETEAFYFLEVNTRLQVEHGVTEEVFQVDLVEWMIKQAAGTLADLSEIRNGLTPKGHAIQVRIYAEDPYLNFTPCPGLLSKVEFPDEAGVRVEHWLVSGIEVASEFDPMLAKLITYAEDRPRALALLMEALSNTHLYGTQTNVSYLQALCADKRLVDGRVTTRYLNEFTFSPERIDVIKAGTMTTIQDLPGRKGYWDVGVPPSGPFDSYSFALVNRLVGNDEDAAGIEITLDGPSLKFSCDTYVALGGAATRATLDGEDIELWQAIAVKAGQVLSIGKITGAGARAYLSMAGGIQCPKYLGSRSTFTLGRFGGHNGRALRTGDVLLLDTGASQSPVKALATELLPDISNEWEIRVMYGPHGAPDFFTPNDIKTFFETDWQVHYNSSRTGVRLIGPKPEWARKDGGEAGLHPSNIHDNAYAFGTIDFTGDMPVILGPDGPSLGGFVCPATVIRADLWKLGQLKAGDSIRFVNVDQGTARQLDIAQQDSIDTLVHSHYSWQSSAIGSPVIKSLDATEFGDQIVYRAAGDQFLLVEYGELQLDLALRFRANAMLNWLQQNTLDGLKELTPGIRSLQVHFDSRKLSHETIIEHLIVGETKLHKELTNLTVPSRIVHIPLSWDDEVCRQAIEKYTQSVRANAPWCPSNLEFIRRANGLKDIEAVKKIVFEASYLVMGLGDVYLGAPVAVPIDPRHRLVTTKYNPARTWTAENSVGIGGTYLCVYGMEGPGGYQFVGRTLQMWNRYHQTKEFSKPWLLRFFDQIRFYEVTHDELEEIRKDFPKGKYPLKIENTEFSLADYQQFKQDNADSIDAFIEKRDQEFANELAEWHANGQFNFEPVEEVLVELEQDWPEDSLVIESPVAGSLWKTQVNQGQILEQGQTLAILESMKMEIPLLASQAGKVTHVLLKDGQRIQQGQALFVMETE